MAMKKGTGFSQILQDVFDSHTKRYGIDKNDPTNTESSIMTKAQKKYWETHPSSEKSESDFFETSAFDELHKKIFEEE